MSSGCGDGRCDCQMEFISHCLNSFSPESHKNLTTKEKNIKKLKGSHLSIVLYSLRVTILFYFEPGTEFWRSFC